MIHISDEELIKSVQQRAAVLGRTPLSKEFRYYSMAARRFGSWNNFLKAARLTPSKVSKRKASAYPSSKSELIDELVKLSAELGETPRKADFAYYKEALAQFGSWSNFVKKSGLKKRSRGLSEDQLLAAMKERAAELGYTPLASEFKHSQTVKTRYPSWDKFIKKAGLPVNNKSKSAKQKKRALINELRQLRDELGETPRSADFKHYNQAIRVFGSWARFIEASGLKKRTRKSKVKKQPKERKVKKQPRKQLTSEELIQLVQAEAKRIGQTPVSYRFPDYTMAVREFGSWEKFLKAAGLKPHKPVYVKTNQLSEEELIQEFIHLSNIMEETPRSVDFKYYRQAFQLFGSWPNFVKASGLEPRKRGKAAPSKQKHWLDLRLRY